MQYNNFDFGFVFVEIPRRGSVELDEDATNDETVVLSASPRASPRTSPKHTKRLLNTNNASVLGSLSKRSQNNVLVLTNAAISGSAGKISGSPRGVSGGGFGSGGSSGNDTDTTPNKKKGSHKHRRVATETSGMSPFGPQGGRRSSQQSNQDYLEELSRELTKDEANHMKKLSNEFRYERDLKHALIKLAEKEEQLHTATEIMGNLEREVEDYKQENERLSMEYTAAMTEIKILDQKCQSLQEIYQQERKEYEESVKQQEMNLQELQERLQEQTVELEQTQARQQDVEEQNKQLFNRIGSIGSDIESSTGAGINTINEKKIYEKYQNEKRKVFDRDQKIEQLLTKLEDKSRLEAENRSLNDELQELQESAEQDLMNQALARKAMEKEVIALASRNSALEKEKEELQNIIDQRDYEAHQLRAHLDRGRTMTNRQLPNLKFNSSNNVYDNNSNDISQNNLGTDLESQMEYQYDEEYYDDDDEYVDEEIVEPEKPKKEKPQKEVPDVVKEYLHLTASAVKIRFPLINTIESAQLIKQVQEFSFWEYHDMMVRIMKNEQAKLDQKRKQEAAEQMVKQQQLKNNTNNASGPSGMLGKFRSFFSIDNNTNNNNTRLRGGSKQKARHHTTSMIVKPKTGNNNNNNNNSNGTRPTSKSQLNPKANNKTIQQNGGGKITNSTKNGKKHVVSRKDADNKNKNKNKNNNNKENKNEKNKSPESAGIKQVVGIMSKLTHHDDTQRKTTKELNNSDFVAIKPFNDPTDDEATEDAVAL